MKTYTLDKLHTEQELTYIRHCSSTVLSLHNYTDVSMQTLIGSQKTQKKAQPLLGTNTALHHYDTLKP